MYKYKVETYKVNDAAEAMNALAAQGWRVIAVSPMWHSGLALWRHTKRKRIIENYN